MPEAAYSHESRPCYHLLAEEFFGIRYFQGGAPPGDRCTIVVD